MDKNKEHNLDHIPMRREAVFSKGGSYPFAVDKNTLLHKEAAETVYKVIKNHKFAHKACNILDLACGALPIIIAQAMSKLDDIKFNYTGVDINSDQVKTCRETFKFSSNVTSYIFEGNSWDLNKLPLPGKYDIVFIGLNTHHATPEEIYYLAEDMHNILKPNGLFINHDLFRLNRFHYFRRPQFQLVTAEALEKRGIPEKPLLRALKQTQEDWRKEYIGLHERHLLSLGMNKKDLGPLIGHIRARDYPISTDEMRGILEEVGFEVTIYDYLNTDNPRREYINTVIAYRKWKIEEEK